MVIDNVKVVAKNMNILKAPIEAIKLKHIKLLLTAIGRNSAHKFNKFRSYLGILFNELREIEVTTINICAGISKSKEIKKIRQTLTQERRIEVANHLKAKNYPFYRFAMIFYHSGCREEELLCLKVKDINIQRQEMKVLVKKGRLYRDYSTNKSCGITILRRIGSEDIQSGCLCLQLWLNSGIER